MLAPELATVSVPLPPVPPVPPVLPVLPPDPLVFVSGAVLFALQAAMSVIIMAITERIRIRMRGFE